ncbi:MAG: glycosyl hydrolase family 18 protein [Patescibacteria group bacterium]
MEREQKVSLGVKVLGLLCAGLFFVLGGTSAGAATSAITYVNKYTEDFSTTTYKDSDNTTLNWNTSEKDLFLPWDSTKKVTSGTAVSKKINLSSDLVTGARLTDLSNFESKYKVSYNLSNDGGKTWLAVSSGQDISFVSIGNDLRWKIVLANTDLVNPNSPTVDGLTVSYTTTNASLNIVRAGKTITAQKGDKGVELESLDFVSKGSQSITLHNLVFRATSGTASATKALDAVYLYRGSTQIAKAVLNSENDFKFDSSFIISANSSLPLTLKGDISSATGLSSMSLNLHSYNVAYGNTNNNVKSYFSGTSSVVKIADGTISQGQLSLALAGKTVNAAKGDKGVVLESVNLKNTLEREVAIKITTFDLLEKDATIVGGGNNLLASYLYLDDKLIATGDMSDKTKIVFNKAISVPALKSSTLVLKVDISKTAYVSSVTSKMNFENSFSSGSGLATFTPTAVTGNASVVKIATGTSPIGEYALTVANGTGSGSYASVTKVAIAASAAPAGKKFDKWTGDTADTGIDVNASSTTVTMPSKAVTLTATYKDVSSTMRWCFWSSNIDPDVYQPVWDEVTVVLYIPWVAHSDGSIVPENLERFLKVRDLAHQHNKKFMVSIGKPREDDRSTIDNIIANHKTEFADNVLNILQTYGVDGVDIDFEYPSPDKNLATNTPNTPLVEAFFKTLHAKIKGANPDYIISADTNKLSKYAVYANSNLSQYLDYVMHMGYHYYGDGSTGGNSPFDDPERLDVKDAIEDLLKYYPSQKIILGLSLYAYESQTDSDQPYAKVTEKTYKQRSLKIATDKAAKYGRLWDASSHTPWYRYKVEDKWYQGWYDDEESYRLKYDYAKSVNLGGVGLFALGWEADYPEVWKEIFSGDTLSSQPTDQSNIKDGAMIRVKGGIDVYIVKYNNGKKFKRLILNPSVFKSYGHLKWKDIIEVDQATLDSYTTSDIVYVAGDKRIWKLEPAGDNGKKSDCTSSTGSYDMDGAYEINPTDRDSYKS